RDAADRLLHRLDDRRRHLVGARAGERERHVDRRRIGAREEVDAEVAEREDPEHDERHDEHRREHGAADAEFREHESSGYSGRSETLTRGPSVSLSTSVIATVSPVLSPLRTSMRSPIRSPTFSSRAARRSPLTTNTRLTP